MSGMAMPSGADVGTVERLVASLASVNSKP